MAICDVILPDRDLVKDLETLFSPLLTRDIALFILESIYHPNLKRRFSEKGFSSSTSRSPGSTLHLAEV